MNSKNKATRPAKGPVKNPGQGRAEAPTAEFLTIAWLLTVMTTLACEVGYFVVTMISNWRVDAKWLELLAGVLMFAALVTGLMSVGMLFAVRRMRKIPPPTPIVIFSVIVGVTPILLAIARAFRT